MAMGTCVAPLTTTPSCNDSPERRVVRAGTLQARCPLQLLLQDSVMNKLTLVAFLGFAWSTQALANGLEVADSGTPPARKVAVVSPGVYKAVVWQESGGGIMEFYDLVQDPKAKWNLAGWDRGLFEVGWHGAQFQSPADKKDCCVQHMLARAREGPGDAGTRD